MLLFEISVLVMLILLNGVLAMSELAIVSARKSRIRRKAAMGDRKAVAAMQLIEDPTRFLATVQVGITLVGVFAGAFGGVTLADRLGDWLETFPIIAPNGDAIGVAVVVVAITYFSIVVGELVPKRVALSRPEQIGMIVAPPMRLFSRLAAPIVLVLKVSTNTILRLLGLSHTQETKVTEDEVKSLIAEAVRSGTFVPQEREMMEGVLRLADRSVRVLMTPRTEIIWVGVNAGREDLGRIAAQGLVSRLLVCEDSVDHVLGSVHTKNLLALALKGEDLDIRAAMAPVVFVLDNLPVLKLLDRFRRERVHMAVVVDEYGVTEGIVTLADVLEAIAGAFPEEGEHYEPYMVQRADGNWLVDGATPIDEVEDKLGLAGLGDTSRFDTLAGFVLHQLGRLPSAGESFSYGSSIFEIVDMDHRRIDKVLIFPGRPDRNP